jgi:U1 small nuclear ribonucleoprotein
MTDKLPPNLLALFTPRPPLRFLPAADYAAENRHTSAVSGVAQYLNALQTYKETDVYHPTESWLQRRDRVKAEKREKAQRIQTEDIKECTIALSTTSIRSLTDIDKPAEEGKKRGYGNAYHTLFVGRLSYNTEQKDLEREFSRFGPIERVRFLL